MKPCFSGPLVLLAVIAFAAAIAFAPYASAADDDRPDVRELMSSEDFLAAGLDKLTPKEIDALNDWLVRFTAKDAPELQHENAAVKEEIKRVEQEGIRSRIVGEFRGWDGDTVFRLENGQVWKQRIRGRWFYRATAPEVELKKNFLGFWEMRIVEANRAVGVTRID
jgi:hypothetical protein